MMSSTVLHTNIMAKRKKKSEVIKLKLKPVWKLAKGHSAPCPGAGQHDSRTQRQRTRHTRNRSAIEEQSE